MSFDDPQSFIICPHLIVQRDKKILLLKRADWAPLFPGHWHCVTGKIENGETPKESIIREAYEEIGIQIDPELKTTVAVKAQCFNDHTKIWRDLSLFFVTHCDDQEPVNKEPRLHDAMDWFDVNNLPEPIIPVVKIGMEHLMKQRSYGEFINL